MKKDHIRDYATEAFRYYARIGKTAEEVRTDIGLKLIEQQREHTGNKGNGSPTEWAIMKKEQIICELQAEIADIDAVDKTLNRLDKDTRRAIEIVYFTDADKDLEKSDISNRVNKASLSIPCGERSVYRALKKARDLFAEERGLRVSWQ